MHKPQLVAVDTKVLLRLADGHEATIDAWQLIKRRLNPVQFILLPTVLGALASKLTDDADPRVAQTAAKALKALRPRWHFQPTDFNAVEEAVAANAVQRLRDRGIVPYEARNARALSPKPPCRIVSFWSAAIRICSRWTLSGWRGCCGNWICRRRSLPHRKNW